MGKWCLANFTCQEVCQRGTVSGIIPNLATALVISQYFALDLSQKSCQTGGWKTGLPFTELGFKKGVFALLNNFFLVICCSFWKLIPCHIWSHRLLTHPQIGRYSHHWIGFREQFTGDFNIQWEHPWFQHVSTIVFPIEWSKQSWCWKMVFPQFQHVSTIC